MSNKRAQGLSLNVIIIAAVVLIVLVVLWSIFTGRMGLFTKGLTECRGTCELKKDCQAIALEGHEACPNMNIDEGVETTLISVPQGEDKREYCCLIKNA
jgi:hypothetical protein